MNKLQFQSNGSKVIGIKQSMAIFKKHENMAAQDYYSWLENKTFIMENILMWWPTKGCMFLCPIHTTLTDFRMPNGSNFLAQKKQKSSCIHSCEPRSRTETVLSQGGLEARAAGKAEPIRTKLCTVTREVTSSPVRRWWGSPTALTHPPDRMTQRRG